MSKLRLALHSLPIAASALTLVAATRVIQKSTEEAEASPAAPVHEPITIGHVRTIPSKVLGEDRRLRISLPDGYESSKTRCGVLYLLDGDSLFPQAAGAVRHNSEDDALPMIVVGIDNTERTRDLTPPAGKSQTADFPTSGGSAKFRRFLVDELQPFIDAEYRTHGVRLLAGHSFGGLFAVETLLEEPSAFTGYLCMSPSLWWDEESFVQRLKDVPLDHGLWKRFAWFSMGDEGSGMNGPFEAATWALKERAPADFRFGRAHFEEHDHWAAALPALGAGYRAFLSPLREIGENVETFSELEARAAEASALIGTELPVARNSVAGASYRLKEQGRPEDALRFIDEAIAKIPEEPLHHYMRADFLGELKRFEEGVASLEASIKRFGSDPKHKLPVMWMRRRLVAMKGKL